MLNRNVLIKLLNTRSSTTGQGLCRATVWFAEEGIWGRRESVGGKQSTEHQSHSPRLDKPRCPGLGNPSCKWVRVHWAALWGDIHQNVDKLGSGPPAVLSKGWVLEAGEAGTAHVTLLVVCSLPMQAFLLWDSPVAASIQEQYCESLPPVTNHTGECLRPQPTLAIPRGP